MTTSLLGNQVPEDPDKLLMIKRQITKFLAMILLT
jgi:hypothetical protein